MAGTGDDPGDIAGDVRGQIREFLTTRRARISPEQAGLPVYDGGRRRVKGLRREEAALLAGVSTEYHIRLERGTATGVSAHDDRRVVGYGFVADVRPELVGHRSRPSGSPRTAPGRVWQPPG